MRLTLATAVLALGWAPAAWADDNDWGELAVVSTTMGVHDGRLCLGEGSRGDLGCPTYAPQVLSSGLLSTSNISATGAIEAGQFIGDGSLLSGLPGGDRIVSGTTSVIAAQDRSVTISTMGTERLLVGENGRIAVGGVPNPSVTLHLKTNGSFTEGSIAARRLFVGAGGLLGDFSTLSDTVGNAVIFMNGGAASFYGPGSSPAYDTRVFSAGARNLTVEYQSSGATKSFNVVNNGTGILRSRFDGVMLIGGTSTSLPGATLHVSGTIRMADGGEACDASRAGAMRYTSASTFDFCDGTNGWRSLAAMATAGGVTTDRLVSGTSNVTVNEGGDISFSTAGTVRASLDTGGSLTVAGVVNANRIRESTTGMYLDYWNTSSKLGIFGPNGDAKVAFTIVGGSAQYGQVLADDAHSNAYPQYSFMSDDDTGMIGVSGTLRLVTNGSEGFRVNEYGQVAIGTTQPSDTLHVAGGNVMVSHASTGQYKWQYDPGQSIWSVGGGDYFTVKRGSTRLLNVDSSGRMGLAIGGLAASTTLHVNGTLRMADGGEACDTDRAGAVRYTSASTFDFCDGTNGWRSLAAMASAGGVTSDRIVSGTTSVIANQNAEISFSTSAHFEGDNRKIYFGGPNTWVGETSNSGKLELRGGGNNSAKTVFITSDGSMGVGTSVPTTSLTVLGNADVSGTVKVAGTGGEPCSPSQRGTLRQNPVTLKLEICRY